MIHVVVSNRTEQLLAALGEALGRERALRSPFEPARLVVPNRNVETYLKLGLAQADGIAANLEVTFLRKLLARVVRRGMPEARVVDARQIEGHLLDLLHDDAVLTSPELAAVREYLHAAGEGPDAIDLRRCQLGAELARLFDEYALSRFEMLAAWRSGPTLGGTAFADTEAWQRRLWLEIFGPDGRCARRSAVEGTTWLPLLDLVETGEALGRLDLSSLRPALHVFGVSYLARGFHRMFQALGRSVDVHIYMLAACDEPRERQLALPSADDPFGLDAPDFHPALRLWARPGRESLRLLERVADGGIEQRFVAHGGDAESRTLLGAFQDEIRDAIIERTPPSRRSGGSTAAAATADGSIEVLPCPGLRRELEVVAAEIWKLVHADPTLRFNDIAVIVPAASKASNDRYLAHLPAVFRESHDLPHSLLDLPASGAHRIAAAMEMLLALPFSSFSRRDLLPLLTHPSVIARFPDAVPADWIALPAELGILHGADHADHRGTHIRRDLCNWDQGLRRLALGVAMAGSRDGVEDPVGFGEGDARQLYLPAGMPPDRESSALDFALLARSLIEDARFASGATGPRARPLGEWLEFVRALFAAYLVPQGDDEEAFVLRCLREIEDLDDMPLGARPVSFRVAAELVGGAVGAQAGSRGQYLSSGVTVASFVPMRAIPFRALYLVGLAQGAFPTATRRGRLDLRAARRAAGDVEPREQDRYMFLEALLCARDRLVLSYVARDEVSGDRLLPSSVVIELCDLLGRRLDAAEMAKLRHAGSEPPLRRFHDDERIAALPPAERERTALRLGESLREALPTGSEPPDLPALRRALPPRTAEALAMRLGAVTPPLGTSARDAAGPARAITVSLAEIRKFLEDPLQGSARFRLRMRDGDRDDEAAAEQDEEPFATGKLERATLLREVMTRVLLEGSTTDGTDLRRTYGEVALRDELGARLPTGLFREAERPGHDAILDAWRGDLTALGAGAPLVARVVRFGPARERETAEHVRPPIEIEVATATGDVPVRVVGATSLLVSGAGTASASLILTTRSASSWGSDDKLQTDRLKAFVDHVALAAGGEAPVRHEAVIAWAIDGEHHQLDRRGLAPLDADTARQWLRTVVGDMLAGAADAGGAPTGVHPYLLPCEAVFQAKDGKITIAEAVEKLRDDFLERPGAIFSSVNGPVPQAVERHEPLPDDAANEIAGRRFGLYFSLVEPPPAPSAPARPGTRGGKARKERAL